MRACSEMNIVRYSPDVLEVRERLPEVPLPVFADIRSFAVVVRCAYNNFAQDDNKLGGVGIRKSIGP